MNFKEEFHKWFYTSEVWKEISYLGVPCQKCPFDLWNYQEIVHDHKIGLVVEFGTLYGGATKYFSHLMRNISDSYAVLSFDITLSNLYDEIYKLNNVKVFQQDTSSVCIKENLVDFRSKRDFPALFVLDSDHRMDHVYKELINVKDVLRRGDYLIVEDSNLNGNPVVENFGKGPMEAINKFLDDFPDILKLDSERISKFGFSFAPKGYFLAI